MQQGIADYKWTGKYEGIHYDPERLSSVYTVLSKGKFKFQTNTSQLSLPVDTFRPSWLTGSIHRHRNELGGAFRCHGFFKMCLFQWLNYCFKFLKCRRSKSRL